MSWLRKFRDPVSGLTHLAGSFLGIAGLVFLVVRSRGSVGHVVPLVIFSTSVILLYSSSALYHLLHVSENRRVIFRRIDHTMIFVLIAGSYTPFCLIAMRGVWGWSVFGVVWGLALLGLFRSVLWIHAPRWLSTGLYLLMGWIIVVAIYPLYGSLSAAGLSWLVVGGLFYTVGAVIYAIKRPDPFPGVFGFHEIWHLFVLAGTVSHFFSVATLLP